jgi:hypothetical protein
MRTACSPPILIVQARLRAPAPGCRRSRRGGWPRGEVVGLNDGGSGARLSAGIGRFARSTPPLILPSKAVLRPVYGSARHSPTAFAATEHHRASSGTSVSILLAPLECFRARTQESCAGRRPEVEFATMRGARPIAVLLAAVHILGCGQLGYLLSDVLFPRTKKVTEDFPCANHGCGCESAEDCRDRCCCAPSAVVRKSPPRVPAGEAAAPACCPTKGLVRTVPVSYLEAARCSGTIPDHGLSESAKLQIPPSPPTIASVPRVKSHPKPTSERLGPPPAKDTPDPVPKPLS